MSHHLFYDYFFLEFVSLVLASILTQLLILWTSAVEICMAIGARRHVCENLNAHLNSN
jgi:hypothetical protein